MRPPARCAPVRWMVTEAGLAAVGDIRRDDIEDYKVWRPPCRVPKLDDMHRARDGVAGWVLETSPAQTWVTLDRVRHFGWGACAPFGA